MKIYLHSLIALALKCIGAGAAFAMTLVLARSLGPSESGFFLLALTVAIFLSSVTRCGLDNVILRHTSASAAQDDLYGVRLVVMRSLVVVGAVSGISSFIIFVFASELATLLFDKPELGPVFEAIAPAVAAMALLGILAQSFQGMRRIAAAVMGMTAGVNLVFLLVLTIASVESAQPAAVWFLVSSVVVLIAAFWHWRSLVVARSSRRHSYNLTWRSMIVSAGPLWLVLLLNQLIQWFGQFVAGAYVSPEEVAQLAIAQRTAMLTSFVLMAVNLVVAPRFASLYAADDLETLRVLALNSVRIIVFGATPAVALMLVFPEWLMGLFGSGFEDGSHLLQILAVGQFVNVVTGSVGYLLMMSGHEKDMRNTLLIVASVSIVITLVLTPLYGATGSAISTAIAVGAQNLLAVYWVRRRLGFNTLAVWRFSSGRVSA